MLKNLDLFQRAKRTVLNRITMLNTSFDALYTRSSVERKIHSSRMAVFSTDRLRISTWFSG